MNKTLIRVMLLTVMIGIITISTTYGGNINTETHQIEISKENDTLSIKESFSIRGTSNETYDTIGFWISDNAMDINVLVSNNEVQFIPTGNNDYICNISSFNITENSSMQLTISYSMDKQIKEFEKKLTYNTSSISVVFDENKIYSGNDLESGALFTLLLYEPTETPVSWYIIVFIMLLLILLAVSTLYSFRKQKTSKRDIINESEELLSAKKTIFMSILKDIEKQHRSKQISDDTHHKLKEHYKQQAVETMRKLENKESEV